MPARARRAGVRAFKTEYSTSDAVNLFSAFLHGTVLLVPQVPVSRAVDRLCCKVRAIVLCSPVWFWIVFYEKYSIRVDISLCTVVKARQARVTGPRSWSLRCTPYQAGPGTCLIPTPPTCSPVPLLPREGVVIIAATRGQHYLGDNGLGHGPVRLPHGRPSGPVRARGTGYASRGTCRPSEARLGLVVYSGWIPMVCCGSHIDPPATSTAGVRIGTTTQSISRGRRLPRRASGRIDK